MFSRTLEVLDQRGIADRFVSQGQKHPAQGYAGIILDVTDFPSRHNYVLGLNQNKIEPILAAWVEELGVPMLRRRSVVGFSQDDHGVTVDLSDGSAIRAEYLVGCDGGRSTVRKAAGIEFAGVDPSTSWILAEVEMSERPQLGMRPEGGGIGPVNPGRDDGLYGVVLTERQLKTDDTPSLDELTEALVAAYGTDFGAHNPTLLTRFTDVTRQAVSYRHGRVLLAGDAAHIHPPHGGQGLNTGVQDAVNLGWKLAQVVERTSPASLLDTYQTERHPVAARVLRNTMAQVTLSRGDERHQALRDAMTDLLALEEPRRHVTSMLSALDVHYDLGNPHPMVGRRMPDLNLHTAAGSTRVYELLHQARGVFLNLREPGQFDLAPWINQINVTDVRSDKDVVLPIIGTVGIPSAVLIRPDGHVAWAGDRNTDPELIRALTKWFGTPSRS